MCSKLFQPSLYSLPFLSLYAYVALFILKTCRGLSFIPCAFCIGPTFLFARSRLLSRVFNRTGAVEEKEQEAANALARVFCSCCSSSFCQRGVLECHVGSGECPTPNHSHAYKYTHTHTHTHTYTYTHTHTHTHTHTQRHSLTHHHHPNHHHLSSCHTNPKSILHSQPQPQIVTLAFTSISTYIYVDAHHYSPASCPLQIDLNLGMDNTSLRNVCYIFAGVYLM